MTIDHFRYYAGWATKIEGETIPINGLLGSEFLDYTLREPMGVVGERRRCFACARASRRRCAAGSRRPDPRFTRG
jgi:hypothetical protein